jgi:hypothetical protein
MKIVVTEMPKEPNECLFSVFQHPYGNTCQFRMMGNKGMKPYWEPCDCKKCEFLITAQDVTY